MTILNRKPPSTAKSIGKGLGSHVILVFVNSGTGGNTVSSQITWNSFKLARAPVSSTNIISLLNHEQSYLLSAIFEINGSSFQVMIDTGASISCLPELGKVLSTSRRKTENANLLVQVATLGVWPRFSKILSTELVTKPSMRTSTIVALRLKQNRKNSTISIGARLNYMWDSSWKWGCTPLIHY